MPEANASATAEQQARELHGAVIVRAGQLVSASQQWQVNRDLLEIERVADGLQCLREGGIVQARIKNPEDYFGRLLHRLWLCAGKPNQLRRTETQYRARFPKPDSWNTHVHRHHTLYLPVEPKVGLVNLCAGFKIACSVDDSTFGPWDQALELPQWAEPHWMWCQPGPWFFNWEPRKVRSEGCAPKEWPLSDREGVHVWGLTGPYPFVTGLSPFRPSREPRVVRFSGAHRWRAEARLVLGRQRHSEVRCWVPRGVKTLDPRLVDTP